MAISDDANELSRKCTFAEPRYGFSNTFVEILAMTGRIKSLSMQFNGRQLLAL